MPLFFFALLAFFSCIAEGMLHSPSSGCTATSVQSSRAMVACKWRFECIGGNLQAQNGATALHGAAANGHADVVRELLLRGGDADIQNSNCSTALHLAASKGVGQCCCCGPKCGRSEDNANTDCCLDFDCSGADMIQIVERSCAVLCHSLTFFPTEGMPEDKMEGCKRK